MVRCFVMFCLGFLTKSKHSMVAASFLEAISLLIKSTLSPVDLFNHIWFETVKTKKHLKRHEKPKGPEIPFQSLIHQCSNETRS